MKSNEKPDKETRFRATDSTFETQTRVQVLSRRLGLKSEVRSSDPIPLKKSLVFHKKFMMKL